MLKNDNSPSKGRIHYIASLRHVAFSSPSWLIYIHAAEWSKRRQEEESNSPRADHLVGGVEHGLFLVVDEHGEASHHHLEGALLDELHLVIKTQLAEAWKHVRDGTALVLAA